MTFNKDTNTITLDENSDFLVDSGVYFIHILRKTALKVDASAGELENWQVIKKWLGCESGHITSVEEKKIGKGWKAYLARGLAPSLKLQEAFDFYEKQYRDPGYSFSDDWPPTEVIDVFDRLLATENEIAAKKIHDLSEEKKKWESVLKKPLQEKPISKKRLLSFSKNSRIFISSSITWFVWVVFRTMDDWEILGIYLDDWDEDMFFANVGLPILAVWFAFKMYKWISSASK